MNEDRELSYQAYGCSCPIEEHRTSKAPVENAGGKNDDSRPTRDAASLADMEDISAEGEILRVRAAGFPAGLWQEAAAAAASYQV